MSGPERTVMFQLPSVVSGQLVCVEGSVTGRSWDLSAGTFVIGRQEGCDLHLANEPGVSKVHCKIVAEGEAYRLIDAESRNGTILNGAPTQSGVLTDGDVIQVCGCKLRFTQKGGGSGRVLNPASMEVTEPSQIAPAPAAPAPPSAPPAMAPPTVADAPSLTPAAAAAPLQEPQPTAEYRGGVQVAPALVEVRGSTLWSFFTGLFVVLICGGGAYAALLYVGDGQLPPPNKVLGPGDGDGAAAGDGDPSDPIGPAGPSAGADGGSLAEGVGAPTGDGGGAAVEGGDANNAGDDPEDGDGTASPGGDGDAEPDPSPEVAPSATTAKPAARRARTRRPRKKPDPAPATDPSPEVAAAEPDPEPEATAAPEPPPPESAWYSVTFNKPSRKAVRVPAGGRVKSVDAVDGSEVSRGQVLAVTESASGSAAEIATKNESIRALKSIVEASGDPEAAKLLSEEQSALKAMQASSRSSKITAPQSGRLVNFRVKAGETLRSRLVVGFVESLAEPSLSATVPKAVALKVKPGSTVALKTPAGEEEGVVKGKPRKRGKTYTVTIVAGGVDLSLVSKVKLP